MASTNFVNGTAVEPEWLNDVDDVVYGIDTPTGAEMVGSQATGTATRVLTVSERLDNLALSTNDYTGVDLSGGSDSSTALRNQIADALSTGVGNTNAGTGLTSYSRRTVSIPKGVFRVDTSLVSDATSQAINHVTIQGEGSILNVASGVTAIGGIGSAMKFKNFQIHGGATGLSIKTNNVDQSVISMDDMVFMGQSNACIAQDATSNSTLLTVKNSRFVIGPTGTPQIYNGLSGDYTVFDTCWFSAQGAVAPMMTSHGVLLLRECVGVPASGMTTWFANHNVIDVSGFRIGGESTSAPIVTNYAAMDTNVNDGVVPTRVSLRDCTAYAGAYCHFVELPNIVEVDGLFGLSNPNIRFTFDSGLDYTDFFNFQKVGSFVFKNNMVNGLAATVPAFETTANGRLAQKVFTCAAIRNGSAQATKRSRFAISEVFGSSGHGGGWAVTSSNVSVAFVNNQYLVQRLEATATADNAQISTSLGTYLNQAVLTPGEVYTLITEVEATGDHTTFEISIGGAKKTVHVQAGRSVISVPFVYLNFTGSPSSTYDSLAFTTILAQNGDVVKIGRSTLVGNAVSYDKEVLEIEGTGTPAAFTNGIGYNTGYYRGDLSYRTNVAASGFIGDVCTVQGAPGTWKTFGPVSA